MHVHKTSVRSAAALQSVPLGLALSRERANESLTAPIFEARAPDSIARDFPENTCAECRRSSRLANAPVCTAAHGSGPGYTSACSRHHVPFDCSQHTARWEMCDDRTGRINESEREKLLSAARDEGKGDLGWIDFSVTKLIFARMNLLSCLAVARLPDRQR